MNRQPLLEQVIDRAADHEHHADGHAPYFADLQGADSETLQRLL